MSVNGENTNIQMSNINSVVPKTWKPCLKPFKRLGKLLRNQQYRRTTFPRYSASSVKLYHVSMKVNCVKSGRKPFSREMQPSGYLFITMPSTYLLLRLTYTYCMCLRFLANRDLFVDCTAASGSHTAAVFLVDLIERRELEGFQAVWTLMSSGHSMQYPKIPTLRRFVVIFKYMNLLGEIGILKYVFVTRC